MSQPLPSPSELRAMFGENLRRLSHGEVSISELSRRLGINRTQFNRYLAGESFPRPDVLARVCAYFGVDARVLLEPVEQITPHPDPIANPFLGDFLGAGARDLPESFFPSGFYRFSRRSFSRPSSYFLGVVHVRRAASNTFLRGFENKKAMASQDLPQDAPSREFRGLVMRQEQGVVLLVSRRNSMTSTFNFLHRVPSFENNFWAGYITRTVPETSNGLRVTRMVYEHLGTSPAKALPHARASGFYKTEDLPALHSRFLTPDVPFN